MIVPKESKDILDLMEMVVVEIHPFQVLEKPVIRTNTKPDLFCLKTLRKYINKITVIVKANISKILPNRFALVFNG